MYRSHHSPLRQSKIALVLLVTLACQLTSALLPSLYSMASAQIIIDPPPLPPAPPIIMQDAVQIDLHKIDAVIDGPLATVRVTQIFRNITQATVEGSYVFPLPSDAAVSDFQMTVDGQVLEGQIFSKEEARSIYEAIVRSQRDPALLEYLGRGVFQTSVFPIPPGASRTLEFTYAQVLTQHEGLYRFSYPLRTQQPTHAAVKSLSLRLELRNQAGLRTIYSPSHTISLDRTQGSDQAIIGYERSDEKSVSDFEFFFGVDRETVGLNLLSYKPAGEDGYFLLLAAPALDIAQQTLVERDVVVVLDVSGSMQGEKIIQAQKAVRFIVDQLNPGDRFNLIAFSTGVRLWQSGLQSVSQANLDDARTWIDRLAATGSTDINLALLEGLAQLNAQAESTRPAYLLFLTDGLPTQGEIDPIRIVDNVRNNLPTPSANDRTARLPLRLFSFGVGYDVNTDLLDILSGDLGGRSTYVKPGEAIDERVSQFYAQMGKPVLAEPVLEFGSGMVIDELYPNPLPDFFAGEQEVIVGRYRRGAALTVTLRGQVNGQPTTFSFDNRTLLESGGDPFVARLWATRKIGVLLEQVRRGGADPEITDAIADLSLKYGIVTPYTSYLVQEPGMLLSVPATAGTAVPTLANADSADTPAPVMLAQVASESVKRESEAVAAYAVSGQEAVAASEARTNLREADTVAQQEAVRFAGGRTFTVQSQVLDAVGGSTALWVDTRYVPTMTLETVSFGSDRYFALAAQPSTAEWLSVSPEVIIVLAENQAVRITTIVTVASAQLPETAPVSPLATPTASGSLLTPTPTPLPASEESCGILDWLWGGCKD